MPEVFGQLARYPGEAWSSTTSDMQDIEFTVQKGRLYMLQTRSGKRTTGAAIRIAVEMEKEGLIDKAQAVCRVEPAALDQLLHPRLDPDAARDVITKGPAGVAGGGVGANVFQRRRGRSGGASRARRPSWCGSRRVPKTSTACTRRKVS